MQEATPDTIYLFARDVARDVKHAYSVKETPELGASVKTLGILLIRAALGKTTLSIEDVVIANPALRPFLAETQTQFNSVSVRWVSSGVRPPTWQNIRFWGCYPCAFEFGPTDKDGKPVESIYDAISPRELSIMVHSLRVQNYELAQKVHALTKSTAKRATEFVVLREMTSTSYSATTSVVVEQKHKHEELQESTKKIQENFIELKKKVRAMEKEMELLKRNAPKLSF